MENNKILVIDDDEELCELLEDYLGQEGLEVESVNLPGPGLERALSAEHGLVVLDVMLPGMSGFELLGRLRTSSRIPVIMLTARGEDTDRIVGLEMGADDYLSKPFNPRELVARIRAVGRRLQPQPDQVPAVKQTEHIVVGDVELAPQKRVVTRLGERVELTSVEFDLLEALMTRAGEVVSRQELSAVALGRKFSTFDRSVDVHIASLRKKLGHLSSETERICTIRGVGYLYALADVEQ